MRQRLGHNNVANENTDVGIVVGRGTNCLVDSISVQNANNYAFAGIHVGGETDTHAGSEVKDNTISSGYNRLGFGLVVGSHGWGYTISDAGSVTYNTITGAVVNLAVDGISAGTVQNNSPSSPQGTAGFFCGYGANYSAQDYGSASLQGGWGATIHYNGSSCTP